MRKLDVQLAVWKDKFEEELKIPPSNSEHLASTLYEEIANNISERGEQDDYVDSKSRFEELFAFQLMMDTFNQNKFPPELVRAQIVTQNYICFVYLKDSLFEALKRDMPSGTITKKILKLLLSNPIRAFRNAVAHGNWKYNKDFSGLEFWARKGNEKTEPVLKWYVSNEEHSFWQTLSRAVAYVYYTALFDLKDEQEEKNGTLEDVDWDEIIVYINKQRQFSNRKMFSRIDTLLDEEITD